MVGCVYYGYVICEFSGVVVVQIDVFVLDMDCIGLIYLDYLLFD